MHHLFSESQLIMAAASGASSSLELTSDKVLRMFDNVGQMRTFRDVLTNSAHLRPLSYYCVMADGQVVLDENGLPIRKHCKNEHRYGVCSQFPRCVFQHTKMPFILSRMEDARQEEVLQLLKQKILQVVEVRRRMEDKEAALEKKMKEVELLDMAMKKRERSFQQALERLTLRERRFQEEVDRLVEEQLSHRVEELEERLSQIRGEIQEAEADLAKVLKKNRAFEALAEESFQRGIVSLKEALQKKVSPSQGMAYLLDLHSLLERVIRQQALVSQVCDIPSHLMMMLTDQGDDTLREELSHMTEILGNAMKVFKTGTELIADAEHRLSSVSAEVRDLSQVLKAFEVEDVLTALTSMQLDTKCPICYDHYGGEARPYVLPCGHVYCLDCLDRLSANGSSACPMCTKRFGHIGIKPIFL